MASVVAVWQTSRVLDPTDLEVYRDSIAGIGPDDIYQRRFGLSRLPWAYPPSGLILLSPLSLFTLDAIRPAFMLLSVCSVWLTMALVARTARRESYLATAPGSAALTALALLSQPVWVGLWIGQVAPLLMGVCALATLGTQRWWKPPMLGMAVAVKLTPAVFVVWWWLTGRRRSASHAVIGTLVLLLLSWVWLPRSSVWYFTGGLLRIEENSPAHRVSNQSIFGVAARFGLLEGHFYFVACLSIVALAAAMCVSIRVRRAGWTAASVALIGLWSGLAAPLAWEHAFGWWIPLAAAIAIQGRRWHDYLTAGLITTVALLPIWWIDSMLSWSSTPGRGATAWGCTYLAAGLLVTLYLAGRISGRAIGIPGVRLAVDPGPGTTGPRTWRTRTPRHQDTKTPRHQDTKTPRQSWTTKPRA